MEGKITKLEDDLNSVLVHHRSLYESTLENKRNTEE